MKRSSAMLMAALGSCSVLALAVTAAPARAVPAVAATSQAVSPAAGSCVANAIVYHNIRYSNGNWQGFKPPTQPNDTCLGGVGIATGGDGTHVDVLGNSGLLDNIRHPDGSWQGWDRPTQPPGLIQHFAEAADSRGNIWFVASTTTGLYDDMRGAEGGWSGWFEVNNTAPPNLGFITDVAVAAEYGGSGLQVMIAAGGEVYHDRLSLLSSTYGWQGWKQPTQPPCGAESVAAASDTHANVQFLVVDLCGYVNHDIRYANGSWQGWEMPPQPPGDPSYGTLGNAAAAIDGAGEAQFTVTELNSDDITTLYHTVREPDGSWQAWHSPGTPLFNCGRLAVTAPWTSVADFQFATYCWS